MILMSEYLLRIGCAFLTGMFIGVERQYRQRNAGLRTNMLVSVGAAAFTVLSYAITSSSGYGDPTRIAAQIVSGIGFLGGGLILKEGLNVRGLNTAATIWCSAACGTLSGVGMYAEALVLVGFVLLIHCLFRPLCRFIGKKNTGVYSYTIRAECRPEFTEKVRQLMMQVLSFDDGVKINGLFYKEEDDKVVVYCEVETQGEHIALLDLIVSRLRAQFGIINAGWKQRDTAHEEF